MATGNRSASPVMKTDHTLPMTVELPFDELPQDILFEILLRLPAKDVYSCIQVCKSWQKLIDTESFWRAKCVYDGIYSHGTLLRLSSENAKLLYRNRPYRRNLVKNPDASRGLYDWNIIQEDGNGWQVEATPIGSDPIENFCKDLPKSGPAKGCWATSYFPCAKEQVIDLLTESCSVDVLDNVRPPIKVSEWYAARFDCGIKYKVSVMLRREKDGGEIDEWTFADTRPAGREWFKAEHTFIDYKPGVRYICFYHEGTDTQFWAGHYGAKFSLSTVLIDIEENSKDKGKEPL